jgi:uncharacterized membrane protein|tara:strand:+ start:819 stop:1031 length:213 start_codon:yes stop_codon:yes gene_type:complete
MKTFVIVLIVVLFLISIYYFFSDKVYSTYEKVVEKDSRAVDIRRAKKNLHPIINRNVGRDKNGRFTKRES